MTYTPPFDAPEQGFSPRRFAEGLRAQGRVVIALMLREMRLRSVHSRLSYLLALLEPILQLTMMMTIFTYIGRRPEFGTSLLLFLGTGILPFFLFTHVSGRTTGAIRASGLVRALAPIQPLDIMLARALLETLTLLFVAVLLFTFIYATGVKEAIPIRPLLAIEGFAATAFLAIAFGLINGVIGAFFRLWAVFYGVASRSLIFLSGVFFVPDFMPPPVRAVLAWNPLLHGLEWFRSGFYLTYPTLTLDKGYILGFAVVSLLIGLALERVFRARLI
ncbi:ABC-2 type transporter [Ancylobacter novellus DSM 506]|uniref:Transport permease protein n=1 Tax=Ancylobacter novellus (strain ATCC 8093 / DSM 506 / JCM 20403 / CCM 1077 / IAM 12100 / NBRC 12443 / NCIMB 10456) TaxID=639283 RepID=D6ZYE6_ANCN5|nr:ABC transporter permease [Ancylobacter novellus]ADH89058.1 ABC-2 type transporter [Ancylobacter novellus DSM 506]